MNKLSLVFALLIVSFSVSAEAQTVPVCGPATLMSGNYNTASVRDVCNNITLSQDGQTLFRVSNAQNMNGLCVRVQNYTVFKAVPGYPQIFKSVVDTHYIRILNQTSVLASDDLNGLIHDSGDLYIFH